LVQWFPIFIPRGTLISARIQALITVDTAHVLMFANAGTSGQRREDFFSGCDAYGVNPAASQGTSHTPGNSGAESTAANVGSTTSRAYGAVMFSQNGTLTDLTMNGTAYHWELVIGGHSRCEWRMGTTTSENVLGPFPDSPFYLSIPVGTQLQVQAECSGTAQAQDIAFHCFY
jgi:hypothetical protein